MLADIIDTRVIAGNGSCYRKRRCAMFTYVLVAVFAVACTAAVGLAAVVRCSCGSSPTVRMLMKVPAIVR